MGRSRNPKLSEATITRLRNWNVWVANSERELEKLKIAKLTEFPMDKWEFLRSLAPPGYRTMQGHPKEVAHPNYNAFYELVPRFAIKGIPEGLIHVTLSGPSYDSIGYMSARVVHIRETDQHYALAREWYLSVATSERYATTAFGALRAVEKAIKYGNRYTPASLHDLLPQLSSMLPPLTAETPRAKKCRAWSKSDTNTATNLQAYWVDGKDEPNRQLSPVQLVSHLDATLHLALMKAALMPSVNEAHTFHRKDKKKNSIAFTT